MILKNQYSLLGKFKRPNPPRDSPGTRRTKEINSICYPITSLECLKYFKDYLSPFERAEILAYHEIWYFGLNSHKFEFIQYENQLFDDSRGFYTKIERDHLAYRYEIVEELGKGTFGQVFRCYDHKMEMFVAVKILRNKKKLRRQSLKEVEMLKHIRDRDPRNASHVVQMLDFFDFRKHTCIVLELMGENLYDLLSRKNFRGLSMVEIQRFAVAILKCLRFIHREGIIHCDLKPENILVHPRASPATCKVADFGSSCFDENKIYTYIQSRFYRAPEIILKNSYSSAIDMWSLGCIVAELHMGRPLFPGENEKQQLWCIMEVLDIPPPNLVRNKHFENVDLLSNRKNCRPGGRKLQNVLNTNDDKFVSFVSKCLKWNPSERMTSEEGLRHKWLCRKSKSGDVAQSWSFSTTKSTERIVLPRI